MRLSGRFSIQSVVDELCDVEGRSKWDAGVKESAVYKQYSRNLVAYTYLSDYREFAEKRAVFASNGGVYTYASDMQIPGRSAFQRLSTIIAVGKVWRDAVKDTVVVNAVRQSTVPYSENEDASLAAGYQRLLSALVNRLESKH